MFISYKYNIPVWGFNTWDLFYWGKGDILYHNLFDNESTTVSITITNLDRGFLNVKIKL